MDDSVFRSETPIVGGQRGYTVPLVVAVTGHRDLVPGEIDALRDRVRDFLRSLKDERPDRGVSVMTSLDEGADRLVAEVAIDLGIPLTVPLPMAAELYVEDFDTPESRGEFRRLCDAAAEVFERSDAAIRVLRRARMADGAGELHNERVHRRSCRPCRNQPRKPRAISGLMPGAT